MRGAARDFRGQRAQARRRDVLVQMRLDQKNRRSCIVLLLLAAGLIGLIAWMALGGVSSESTGDDVTADIAPPRK